MNEFYQDLLTPIIYKWVSYIDESEECSRHCSFNFRNDEMDASIKFYEENIIELTIKNRINQETLFYLHFQMTDIKTTIDKIKVFLDYLYHQNKEDTEIRNIEKKPIKILLSCSSGITTTYFAHLMQEKLKEENSMIEVNAVGYTRLDLVADQYDLILLAPQISHLYTKLKSKYGSKVMEISTLDFASRNVGHVINEISSHILNV